MVGDRSPIVLEACGADGASAWGRFRVGDDVHTVRFDGVAPEADTAAEAFVAIARVMGMENHQAVEVHPRVSRTFHGSIDRFQAAHLAIFPAHRAAPIHAAAGWLGRRPRKERPVAPTNDDRRAAAFFSGGVDSLDLVVERGDEIDDLIFVRGFDVVVHDRERNEEVLATVREAAAAIGKPLLVIDTDLRDFSDPRADWTWFVYGGLIATAVLLGRTHRLVLCAASVADRHLPTAALAPRATGFGNERSELRIEGRVATRVEKLARVAASGLARDTLRVCWQNVPGTVNCGSCHKCVRTLVGLAAVGRLGHFTTLPAELDLALVAAHPAISRSDRAYLAEGREAAAGRGLDDVVAALDAALAAGVAPPTG